MRLTINLDDDLYAMARSHAIATKTSISKAVGNLLRQRTAPPPPNSSDEPAFYIDPETLLPVVKGSDGIVTNEDIQRFLQEEDDQKMHPIRPSYSKPDPS